MTYTLPALPYAYDALEPHIDATTMEIHHSKHHQTYIDKLNAALQDTDWADKSLHEIIQSIDILPSNIKTVVRNNAWWHWNHSFFWQCLSPEKTTPTDALQKVINTSFGGMDTLKDKLFASAMGVFGSGWVWIIKEYDELTIKTTPNQDNPLMLGEKAILGIDLWEHAYYLKNQNRRAEYLENVWSVINWDFVSKEFDKKY